MRSFIGIIILVLIVQNSFAQETWSMRKCIEHATTNSFNVQQSQISVKFAEIALKQSKMARLPGLSASGSYGVNLGRTIDPTSNDFINQTISFNSWGLNTSVPLFQGFSITNTIKQSKHDLDAALADGEQMVNDISLSVAQAYLSVLFAEEQLKNANNRVDQLDKQIANLEKLIKAGTRPANDKLDLEAQKALQEGLLIGAKNTLETALLSLKQLLELEPDFEMQIEKPDVIIPTDANPDGFSLSSVYELAYNRQPFIKAGDSRIKSAEIGVDIAKAGYYPSIVIFGGLSSNYSSVGKKLDGFEPTSFDNNVLINGLPATITSAGASPILVDNPYFDQLNENFGQNLGVSVNIPIYSNYRVKANQERAKLNILNTRLTNEITKKQLRTQIQNAISDARAAKLTLEASQKSVKSLQAAYDNTERKFKLGASNTLEYSTAQFNLDVAIQDLTIAKYDYIFKLKVVDYYMGNQIDL